MGWFSSIAVDSNNNIHISYGEVINGLKYATNASGSWVTETVDSVWYAGWFTSITTDSNNKVHLSYLHMWSYLMYATNASGLWVTETVDYAQTVPEPSSEYTSIAMDSYNKAHISYVSAGYGLKYATNLYYWFIQTVDSRGGMGNSIAVDSNDMVHIGYFGNGDLKYATGYPLGPWDIQTVASAVYVHLQFYSIVNTSIATDSNNKVHISYYDAINDDLKYATNASGSWVTQTIDSEGDVGGYTSIATDSNNNVHISYYDAINGDLKYATNASGSWVTQVVDSAGGINTSIATDSNNNVHISYYDATNGDLKYATNDILECGLIPDTTSVHRGGTLGFQATVTNNTGEVQVFKFATRITKPGGGKYPATGYLKGPVTVNLGPHNSISRNLMQYVPNNAPLGTYTYHGYVGVPGNIYDECKFNFTVIEQGQSCTSCHQ